MITPGLSVDKARPLIRHVNIYDRSSCDPALSGREDEDQS
jgi:hypothetical protein